MSVPTSDYSPSPADEDFLESRSRAYSALVRVEQVVSCALLVSLFAIIVVQVAARYVFQSPVSGTEELARFTFIWFTFAGASFVAARRKHIIVQLYGGGRTGKAVAAVEVFAYLVVIVVSAMMVYGGFQMVQGTWAVSSPGLGLPFRYVYSALPVGFALVALHSVANLVLALRYPHQFAGEKDVETAGP